MTLSLGHPSAKRCCVGTGCRCAPCRGGAGGGGGGGAGDGGLGVSFVGGGGLGAPPPVAGADLAAASLVAGDRGGPQGAAAALLQTVRAALLPVWASAQCGSSPDCIPAADWQPSFDVAVAGSAAWVKKEPSRFVVIYDRPGGIVLTQVGPLGASATTAVGATHATAGKAIAQQGRQLAGY